MKTIKLIRGFLTNDSENIFTIELSLFNIIKAVDRRIIIDSL